MNLDSLRNMDLRKKYLLLAGILLFVFLAFAGAKHLIPGNVVDSFEGVEIYSNGLLYATSQGKHYSEEGYYFGQKWQCVEFMKRYLYLAKGHALPDGYGNAKDFFDPNVKQGEINLARDMRQYRNGGNESPQVGDVLVFTSGEYGHVAIISYVGYDFVEVVQQNILFRPRPNLDLEQVGDIWIIGKEAGPAGWLRVD